MLSLKGQRIVVMLAAGAATIGGFLDQTIVGVALPSISDELGLTSGQAIWVVVAYLLPLASCAAVFGAVGRQVGERLMFGLGLGGFVLGSMGAGLAVGPGMLIGSRAVQGLAAAAMFTAAQAMVANAFPGGRRGRGIAIYAAITTIALSSGPLVGGFLAEAYGWRWVFFVNPVLSLFAVPYLLGLSAGLPKIHREAMPKPFDLRGLVSLVLALTALSLGLIGLSHSREGALTVVGAGVLVSAGVVFGWFFVHTERRAPYPIVNLASFADPVFSVAVLVIASVGFVQMWGVIAFPAYLQESLGLSPFAAGAGLVPLTLALTLGQFAAGRSVDKLGPRRPIAAGLGLAGLGLLLILVTLPLGTYVWFVPAFLIAGLGLALCQTPANTAAMNVSHRQDRLLTSGLLGTARQTSALTGLVVLSAVGSLGATAFPAEPGRANLAFGLIGALVVVAATVWAVLARLRGPAAGAPHAAGARGSGDDGGGPHSAGAHGAGSQGADSHGTGSQGAGSHVADTDTEEPDTGIEGKKDPDVRPGA